VPPVAAEGPATPAVGHVLVGGGGPAGVDAGAPDGACGEAEAGFDAAKEAVAVGAESEPDPLPGASGVSASGLAMVGDEVAEGSDGD
jgi:hypothetical protein